MVVVQVREQHGVDALRDVRGRRRGVSPNVSKPRAQHRVGEQPNATELEEHGGVSDKGDSVRRLRQPRPIVSLATPVQPHPFGVITAPRRPSTIPA